MIVFEGQATSENAIRIQGRKMKIGLAVCFLLAELIMIIVFWRYWILRQIAVFMTPAIVLFLVIPNKLLVHLPEKLVIDTNKGTILSKCKSMPGEQKKLNTVTKVDDCGDHYAVYFNKRNMMTTFIAQKDLITQGTIEEFEEIFEEVLVRVDKK